MVKLFEGLKIPWLLQLCGFKSRFEYRYFPVSLWFTGIFIFTGSQRVAKTDSTPCYKRRNSVQFTGKRNPTDRSQWDSSICNATGRVSPLLLNFSRIPKPYIITDTLYNIFIRIIHKRLSSIHELTAGLGIHFTVQQFMYGVQST